MYSERVHLFVLADKEPESGISVHFVNSEFDEEEVLHQSKFKIDKGDDLKMAKSKVQQLEYLHFPKVIERLPKKHIAWKHRIKIRRSENRPMLRIF